MQQFARGIGFLSAGAGVFLVFFPSAARKVMRARAEFTRLSPSALRLLGVWEFMMGAMLVSATMPPAAEMRRGQAAPTQLRRAA